jgi:hypothetical protein
MRRARGTAPSRHTPGTAARPAAHRDGGAACASSRHGAAALFLGLGARQIVRGLRRDFLKRLELQRMGARVRRWVDPAGRVGLSAQGLVLALVGVYLLVAAVKRSPGEATGFDGALASVARQPFGTALLGAVAIGLLGYAIFSAIEGATGGSGAEPRLSPSPRRP